MASGCWAFRSAARWSLSTMARFARKNGRHADAIAVFRSELVAWANSRSAWARARKSRALSGSDCVGRYPSIVQPYTRRNAELDIDSAVAARVKAGQS